MGGTGATAYWVCLEAIRNAKKIERKMRETREIRRATRLAMLGPRLHERHSFPCMFACMSCGWLESPPRSGDPMRTEIASEPPRSCPRCGEQAWADLADVEIGAALAEAEALESTMRSSLGATLLQTCVVIALGGGTIALGFGDVPAVFTCTAVGVALALFVQAARKISVALSMPKRTSWRWRAPARRFRAARVIARGPVTGTRMVRSPLTGREGLAWRIEVHYPGDHGDAFALIEQDASELRVADRRLDGEPSIAKRGTIVCVDREPLMHYLLSRGIDPHRPMIVTEVLIEPDTMATLRRDRLGGPPVLCAR